MKLLILAVACSLSLLAPVPAMADWAVAQAAPGGKPFVQRFRSISWASDVALEACRKQYQNCKVVASGSSGCLAIATTGSKWGVGMAGFLIDRRNRLRHGRGQRRARRRL